MTDMNRIFSHLPGLEPLISNIIRADGCVSLWRFLTHRVNAFSYFLPRIEMKSSSLGEHNYWEGAEGHHPLLSIDPVLESPELGPGWRDDQHQPVAVDKWVALQLRLSLVYFTCVSAVCNLRRSIRLGQIYTIHMPISLGLGGTHGDALGPNLP